MITGAAGGIGQATVETFLNTGHHVIGIDRDQAVETLHATPHYRGITADVTDPGALQETANTLTHVHHLIIIAGGAHTDETTHPFITPNVWQETITTNLSAPYYTIHAFHPHLSRTSGDRSVTLVSSINAIQGYGLTGYSAAKAGLLGLTNALLTPLGDTGIRINTIPTPRTRQEWAHNPDHFSHMAAGVPLRKLGEPSDVATTIHATATLLTHLHGTEIPVDGGQSKSR